MEEEAEEEGVDDANKESEDLGAADGGTKHNHQGMEDTEIEMRGAGCQDGQNPFLLNSCNQCRGEEHNETGGHMRAWAKGPRP